MSSKEIGSLTGAATLDGSETVHAVQSGNSRKTTTQDIADLGTSQDNMADGTTNKNYTATEKTKLAGITVGADMKNSDNLSGLSSADTALTNLGGGASGVAVFKAADTAALTTALAGAVTITRADDGTALKAVDTTKYTVAHVVADGARNGTWVFLAGDYSDQVTADTQEALFIKATAIAATAGAWVRLYAGAAQLPWFDTAGDGTTDDTAALAAAFTLLDLIDGVLDIPYGTYLTDAFTVPGIKVTMHPAAVLKQRSALAANASWMTFNGAADWSGGVFDGNKAALSSSFAARWIGIDVQADGVVFNPTLLQNFADIPFRLYADDFRSDRLEGADNGSTIALGYYMGVHKSVSYEVETVIARRTNNNGLAIEQHAVDSWYASGYLGNVFIEDMDGDTSGTTTYCSGLTTSLCDGLTIGTTTVVNMLSDTLIHDCVTHVNTSSNCDWGDIFVYNFSGVGAEIGVGKNITHGRIVADGAYRSTTKEAIANSVGVSYDSPNRYAALNRTALNSGAGVVGELAQGIRTGTGVSPNQAGNVLLRTVVVTGNTGNGLAAFGGTPSGLFSNVAKTALDALTIENIVAKGNGGMGLSAQYMKQVIVKAGVIEGNGQNSALSAVGRCGARISTNLSNQVSATDLTTNGIDFLDGQTWTIADGLSYVPGATDANNRYVFTRVSPFKVYYGQRLKLTAVTTGSADATGWVFDTNGDEITLQFASATTFIDPTLTSLTGTISSSGGTVTGSSTAFATEVNGPYWIKANGQYSQAFATNGSNTSMTTSPAFSPAITAGTSAQKLTATVNGVPSQQYHLYLNNAGSSDYERITLQGNSWAPDAVTAPFAAGSYALLAVMTGGSRYPRLKAVTPTVAATDVWADIPRGHWPQGYTYQVTTAITTAASAHIDFMDSSANVLGAGATGIGVSKNTQIRGILAAPVGITTDSNKVRVTYDAAPGAGAFKIWTDFVVSQTPTFADVA